MASVRRLLALLLMLVATVGDGTTAAARQVDQPDAAGTYEQVWEAADARLWDAVADLYQLAPAWHAEREAAKILLANQETVERLSDATRIPVVIPDEADGWSQLSWDTRNQRRTACLFSVDATRLLAGENADGAAGRVAALLRYAKQLAAEPRISSTAMAATCIEMATDLIGRVVRAPSLTEAGRREMVVAVAGLDQDDPAGFKVGLSGAKRLCDWLAREFKGSDAGERLVESMPIPAERKQPLPDGAPEERRRRGRGWRNGGLWPSRELVAEIRRMDGEDIEEAARDFEAMYKTAMDVWLKPDAADKLEQIDIRADRNAFGPFARLTPLYFSRQRRAADEVNECMDKMRFALIAR
jgi:hypothetical protein